MLPPSALPYPAATPLFRDRREAGHRLVTLIRQLHFDDPLVLGLPRGGVPVAAEVSRALGAPLEVWISKKITPLLDDVAIGAVSEAGEIVVDPELAALSGTDDETLRELTRRLQIDVIETARVLREGRPRPHVRGRCVVLVDDGAVTGLTALAAVRDLKRAGASRVILALPVGAETALAELADDVDDMICVAPLEHLPRVGTQYEDFRPVHDDEVRALLEAARRRAA